MSDRLGPWETGRVHCCDCLEAMKRLPDGCVDHIVTDPPYGMNRFATDGSDYLEQVAPVLGDFRRVLKPGGSAFIFTSTGEILKVGNKVPLDFVRILWLYKPADCTFPLHGWLLTSEAILWFSNGKPLILADRNPYHHDCYIHNRVGLEGVEGHPTVKPLTVIRDLCSRCPSGGVVADFYSGSGTTGVACVQLGRRFLGFEIEQKWADLANERIAAARQGLPLKDYRAGQLTLTEG